MKEVPLKILIADKDPLSHKLYSVILDKHQVTICESGERLYAKLHQDLPDLVILEIELEGSYDGYQILSSLKNDPQIRNIPVIFVTEQDNEKVRIKAYGNGASDFIVKPFDVHELVSKINFLSQSKQQKDNEAEHLGTTEQLLYASQEQSYKLQCISRFIQRTLFCHSQQELMDFFLQTAREINLNAVVYLPEEEQYYHCETNPSALEQEIIQMAGNFDKIFNFGKNRALLSWQSATLLVRNDNDLLDILAILMDALEAGLNSVSIENRLIGLIHQFEKNNQQLRTRILSSLNKMREEFTTTVISLGVVSSLDIEEEDRLEELMSHHAKKIDAELQALDTNNQQLLSLIEELHQPPKDMQDLLNSSQDANDSIDLF